MNKEVIEAMAGVIADSDLTISGKVDAILDLRYKCKECRGTKEQLKDVFATHDTIIPCPSCKGTGKGEPMIGVLSENQELVGKPRACKDTPEAKALIVSWIEGYHEAQQDMISQGWRKIDI
jgi:hypothetical protein